MLRSTGHWRGLGVALALLRRLWPDLSLALLVAALSIPLGPSLSRKLSPDLVLPLLGIVASVLIGFRSTQAYARWWEARTLWGQLRNGCRAWKATLQALAPPDGFASSPTRPMLERQVLIVWMLAAELRPKPACSRRTAEALQALQQLCPGDHDLQSLLDAQAAAIASASAAGLLESSGRHALIEQLRDVIHAIGGLERIRAQPFPASIALFSRVVVWLFAWLMFLRLEAAPVTPAAGNVVAFVLMAGYISAERLAAHLDQPLSDPLLGLPQHHICAAISRDLLGPRHPLAVPPQGSTAVVWT